MSIDRRMTTQIGCGAVALLGVVMLTVYLAFEMGYLPLRSFDARIWQKSNRYSDTARVEMIDSLLRSRRLDGLSQSQVLALLGQPQSGGYFQDWDMVYRLGDERGIIRVDSEWLVIRLDRTGHVSEYRVERD